MRKRPPLPDILSSLPDGTKRAIAESAGMSYTAVNYAERRIRCGADAARRLAKALGYPKYWPELYVPSKK